MNSPISFWNSLHSFTLLLIPILLSKQSNGIEHCGKFDCGESYKNISYPFRQTTQPEYCGHPDFVVDCESDGDHPLFEVKSQKFNVIGIDSRARILKIARHDLSEKVCVEKSTRTDFVSTPFKYTAKDAMATLLYGCDDLVGSFPGVLKFPCSGTEDNVSRSGFLVVEPVDMSGICHVSVAVPVMDEALKRGIGAERVLEEGFEVEWENMGEEKCLDCVRQNGSCGYDGTASEFVCFCPPNHHRRSNWSCVPLPSESGKNVKLKIGIASAGAVFGAMIVIVFVLVYCVRRKRVEKSSSTLLSRSSEISSSMDDAEKGGSIHGSIRVFSYEELVEATNNFDSTKELGDGGFGTVYHGKLKDGRSVAVKRLYENNYRRVEQFVNEAKILASVRHENLVSLYGCTSRHCRELLLVYEYVPNGTVADHLHGPRARPGGLTWPARLSIAIDTAAALTYLHRSEIVHRDVKTTNILLDSHFRVKVADFGLSRLFPTEATHVSTAPQGTPGYVDPDYHLCYQLTSKSDVFSFGVVLVELISSMPAVDITRHRHDINLSTMALNRIQNHALHELVDSSLGFKEDPRAQRSITAVAELAFRCLQQEKDMRPSMDDVWEELNANHEREYVPAAETVAVPVPAAASGDDAGAVLLKNGPLTLSPDSLTLSWGSGRSTTPKSSS